MCGCTVTQRINSSYRQQKHTEFYLSRLICRSTDALQQAVGELIVQGACLWVEQRLGEAQTGDQLQHREQQDWTQAGGQLVLLRD